MMQTRAEIEAKIKERYNDVRKVTCEGTKCELKDIDGKVIANLNVENVTLGCDGFIGFNPKENVFGIIRHKLMNCELYKDNKLHCSKKGE